MPQRALKKVAKALACPISSQAMKGLTKAIMSTQAKTGKNPTDLPYWRRKSLFEMSPAEWENLCDGCGRCCMLKLEDEDSGEIYMTRLACKLLAIGSCRCSDYANRHDKVPDCLRFTPDMVAELGWLPETCAYRLVHEGKNLAWWHPLVSGDPETVHQAGISVRAFAMPETPSRSERLHEYIIVETSCGN